MADHVFNKIYRSCVQSSVAFLKKNDEKMHYYVMYDPYDPVVLATVCYIFSRYFYLIYLRCDMSLLLSICLSISWAIAGVQKGNIT